MDLEDLLAAAPVGPSPLLVAAIKGVEYACLGFLVGWLGQRSWAAARHHAAVGLAVAGRAQREGRSADESNRAASAASQAPREQEHDQEGDHEHAG